MKASADSDRTRRAQNAARRFLWGIAGNLPGFEEASRALFAGDREAFGDLIASWPESVREYAFELAFGEHAGE